MATCQINEKGFGISCPHPALESDPECLCILHSPLKDKDKVAFEAALQEKVSQKYFNFRAVVFPSEVSFSGQKLVDVDFARAAFYGRANFQGATFSGKSDFSKTTFQEADFSRATFQKADFSEATFQDANFFKAIFQHAIFSLAKFHKGAFSSSTFHDADFYGTIFPNANFSRAIFHEADFSIATFREANFCMAKINGRMGLAAIISGISVYDNQHFPIWPADLRFLQFGEKGVLRLQNLSLVQAEFEGTDLRQVEFDRVTWASWWWRAAVYDEILLHQRRWAHIAYVLNYGWFWGKKIPGEEDRPRKPSYADFAPVERIYRQLKINYEDERDFKRVGDFHYGEMEMHRRGSPWRQWVPFSWHNLYRVLSGYGERPCRALGWLTGFLLALPLLVWGFGLDSVAAGTTPGFLETFTYIFEKATFQRPPRLSNLNFLGGFISNLSLLIIPGQAALFLLALRNRLGRRR